MTEDHTEYYVSEKLAQYVSCGMIRGKAQMSYLVLTLPTRETCSRPARSINHLSDVVGLRLSQRNKSIVWCNTSLSDCILFRSSTRTDERRVLVNKVKDIEVEDTVIMKYLNRIIER